MGVDAKISEAEMHGMIQSKHQGCKDAAKAAVELVMAGKKAQIDRKEGLQQELVDVYMAQINRYDELAIEWVKYYGSLENIGQGKTFKQNFVDGAVVAVQSHLSKRTNRKGVGVKKEEYGN